MDFRRIEKALVETVLFIGTLCGSAKYGEEEIKELIQHTESVLQELGKPRVSDDNTDKAKQELIKMSTDVSRYLESPDLLDRASDAQAKRLKDLSRRLPREVLELAMVEPQK